MVDATPRPRVSPEMIVERQGKSFVLYAGVLDLAHQMGLKSIDTMLLQIGDDENGQTWLVRAVVTMPSGTFSGLGDANPTNVAAAMLRVLPRLAETRAKARALRDATNVGMAAVEELGGDDEAADQQQQAQQHTQTVKRTVEVQPAAEHNRLSAPAPMPTAPTGTNPTFPGIATQAQVRAIYSIGRDQHKMTEQEIDQRSVDLFGTTPAELSKKQASDFIGLLKAAAAATPPATTPTQPTAPERANAYADYMGLRDIIAPVVSLPAFDRTWTPQQVQRITEAAKEWQTSYLPVFQAAKTARVALPMPKNAAGYDVLAIRELAREHRAKLPAAS